MRLFISSVLIFLVAELHAKDLKEDLIECQQFTFRVNGTGLPSRWSEEFRGNEDILSVPPLLQIFQKPFSYTLANPNYQLQMVLYDAKKREVVSNVFSTNLYDFFTMRLTNETTLTNGFSPKLRHQNGKVNAEFLQYLDAKEVYGCPTPLEISSGTRVYIALGSPEKFSKEDVGYMLVLVKTRTQVFVIKKWIEPKEEFPAFGNKLPLNWKEELFLRADLDGNGTQELIFAAGGREKNRWMTYYNIFFFDKLIEYLKARKIEPVL